METGSTSVAAQSRHTGLLAGIVQKGTILSCALWGDMRVQAFVKLIAQYVTVYEQGTKRKHWQVGGDTLDGICSWTPLEMCGVAAAGQQGRAGRGDWEIEFGLKSKVKTREAGQR